MTGWAVDQKLLIASVRVPDTPLDEALPLTIDGLLRDDFERIAVVFKALADSQRIDILNLISVETQATVSRIVEALDISQSRASYHVKQLVDVGIINGEREGSFTFYRLSEGALDKLADIFSSPLE